MPTNSYTARGKEKTYWRKTYCRVGLHTWYWGGNMVSPPRNYVPAPATRCDCGMISWAEAERLEQEAKVKKET